MKPLLRLTFPKRATSEQRTKKDMTNITSILTKAEIHALLWKGRRKMMGQNIFHFTLKNNMRDDLKAAREDATNAEVRCEELADKNCELLSDIDAFKETIEELKEEIQQKEKLTEGNYEEDKPN